MTTADFKCKSLMAKTKKIGISVSTMYCSKCKGKSIHQRKIEISFQNTEVELVFTDSDESKLDKDVRDVLLDLMKQIGHEIENLR